MDTLDLLLRDEDNYRQGVYWCHKRGTAMSGRLESLLRRDRVYLVEVDGFDEFMADLHGAARLELPKPIRRPFEMAEERARLFIEVKPSIEAHPVIRSHIREVLGSITSHGPQMPLHVQAAVESSRGRVADAIPIWRRAYEEDKSDGIIASRYAEALLDAGELDELVEFVPTSSLSVTNKTYVLLRAGENEKVIDLATKALDEPTATFGNDEDSAIIRINRAIALKRLGRTDEMKADLDSLEQNGDISETNIRAGVAALRQDKEEMFKALDEAMYNTLIPEHLKDFPVFEDYREDPDFIALMAKANDPGR